MKASKAQSHAYQFAVNTFLAEQAKGAKWDHLAKTAVAAAAHHKAALETAGLSADKILKEGMPKPTPADASTA